MAIRAPLVLRFDFGIPYNMGGRASNGSGFSLTRRLRDREGGEWEGAVEGWLADISSAMRNNKMKDFILLRHHEVDVKGKVYKSVEEALDHTFT